MTLLTDKKKFEIDVEEAPPDRWRFQKSWNNTHLEARRAHRAVAAALRGGTLERGKCADCGSLRVEAHHENYDRPLDVIWLCRADHRRRHAEMRRAAQ